MREIYGTFKLNGGMAYQDIVGIFLSNGYGVDIQPINQYDSTKNKKFYVEIYKEERKYD